MAEDSSVAEAEAIKQLIASGEVLPAFARVRVILEWPRGKRLARAELPRWLAMFAELLASRGATEIVDAAMAAVRDPDSPDRMYQLGYELIDLGLPEIAATILWHCLALVGESEEVVCELVSALESALRHPDAFEVLEGYPALRARSYLPRYLHAYNAAMSGRLDVARAVLPSLTPGGTDTESLHATIAGIVGRADRVAGTCPLDPQDLRGWTYVLTGSLLTHQSPYGFDDPMHGRYAWLADSLPLVVTGIDRLVSLVKGLDLPCVYAPQLRDDEILAEAIALRLGIPRAPWPAVGVPAPGLVVLYDLQTLPLHYAPQLFQRRPDQIVYAHASPWTVDSPIAPDVTTLFYQSLVPAWGADERSIEDVAASVVSSPALEPSELVADQAARWEALVAGTWPPAPGPRSRLWAGGPVSSNRFT
ncbi:MAG: hypothetical protein IPQ07_05275 [Myxococcales bacterium]|nr:hypothetical protein [Myxococcales bacterium]